MGILEAIQYVCERCGHKWFKRGEDDPKICPKCKSKYWNKAK